MINSKLSAIQENFRIRNIEVEFFLNLNEVRERLLDLIAVEDTVGIANSQTLKKIMISQELSKRGNIVYDKTKANSKKESVSLKKKSLITDWYMSGANAISKEGQIVNIDHSGNRVAAITYGPDKVIIVVSTNKIEDTLEKAISRARNYAAPLNAKRAGYFPPCVELKKCTNCSSRESVCNTLSIIEGQFDPNRMKLIIVDEEVGF